MAFTRDGVYCNTHAHLGTRRQSQSIFGQPLSDSASDRVRSLDLCSAQEGDEFVAAIAKQDVRHAKGRFSMVRHMAENLIADRSTVFGVDRFQVTDVDK